MTQLVLINISGEDRPGITAAVTGMLGTFDIDVLDIGQAVIHNYLSLGILINIPAASDPVLKEVLFLAHELDLQVKFTPVEEESYDDWVGLQGRSRFILTLLARKIKAAHIAEVARIVAANGFNIDSVVRLSGRVPMDHEDRETRACVEFSLRGEPADARAFRAELVNIASDLDIDVAVQEDNLYRRNRRLVAFDMDSTLISTEVIDELARRKGVGEEVGAVTERAMRGELDFKESLRARVALLEGLPEATLAEVGQQLPLMEGAERLFATLNKLGYKTAILSGGFSYFGKLLQEKLGVDYVYANELEIVAGKLTGKVLAPIVDAERKAELLRTLAAKENISLEQCIAVGDGANDLAMLSAAGLGVAFHAKPIVKESAEQSISTLGLDSILYLMGIRDRDAVRLSEL
ncbi:MAG: phosphoserine phosphatase SerB [Pseudomonadota bacterium]